MNYMRVSEILPLHGTDLCLDVSCSAICTGKDVVESLQAFVNLDIICESVFSFRCNDVRNLLQVVLVCIRFS